eukprot:scaffold368_cov258-Pinguiococcus_pyrenoidosus.AAC.68
MLASLTRPYKQGRRKASANCFLPFLSSRYSRSSVSAGIILGSSTSCAARHCDALDDGSRLQSCHPSTDRNARRQSCSTGPAFDRSFTPARTWQADLPTAEATWSRSAQLPYSVALQIACTNAPEASDTKVCSLALSCLRTCDCRRWSSLMTGLDARRMGPPPSPRASSPSWRHPRILLISQTVVPMARSRFRRPTVEICSLCRMRRIVARMPSMHAKSSSKLHFAWGPGRPTGTPVLVSVPTSAEEMQVAGGADPNGRGRPPYSS